MLPFGRVPSVRSGFFVAAVVVVICVFALLVAAETMRAASLGQMVAVWLRCSLRSVRMAVSSC